MLPPAKWSSDGLDADHPSARRFAVLRDERPATHADVIEAWRGDAAFRAWFNALLAACPYGAFRWETAPVTARTADRPFEFVLVHAPELERHPNPAAFAEPFADSPASDVVTFANLGGDAILVAPREIGTRGAYGHLGAFVRRAPAEQHQAFWRAVGEAMVRRIDSKPVWLNTAGDSVPWLHVRLDDRPKYYRYRPYRAPP